MKFQNIIVKIMKINGLFSMTAQRLVYEDTITVKLKKLNIIKQKIHTSFS